MLYGSVGYSWVDEHADKPIHNAQRARLFQMMGMMDQNTDGKITQPELTPDFSGFVGNRFSEFDKNADGWLNMRELSSVFQAMQEAHRKQAAKVLN